MKGEGSGRMLSSVLNSNRDYPLILLVIFLLLINRGIASADEGKICPKITEIKVEGLYSIPRHEFLSLIDVKKDHHANRDNVKRSVKRLFQKGIYEDIIVRIKEQTETSCVIEFSLIEKKIINSIKIENNNYFSNSFIKKNFSIDTGDRLDKKDIASAIIKLQHSMSRQGYPDAVVNYKIIDKGSNFVDLLLDVNEGNPSIIKKIIINDKSGLVVDYLTVSEGEPFNVDALQKMKERIKEYIQKNLFVSSKIDYSFEEGVLTITFDGGKQTIISLIGNEEISRDTIIKELPKIELIELNDEIIEEFKKRIVNLYYTRGYPHISIIPTINEGDELIEIQFFIFEGQRFYIEDIFFSGNSVPEDKLKSLLTLRKENLYNPNLINSDIETIMEFYASIGYINVSIEAPEIITNNDRIIIRFKISEGQLQRIKSISFKGNFVVTNERLMREIVIKENSPLNEIDIAESKRKILELYKKMGFDNAHVLIKKDNELNIIFEITEGHPILFGKTLYRGNSKTKYWVFHRERLHKDGDIFQRSIILRERQKLYRTGLFSDIQLDFSEPYKADESEDKSDSILYRDVIFTVNEAPAGAVEFGAGYGEYENIRGFLELSYKNLWGLNRQGTLRTEVSSIEQRFILSYYDPWFFRENLPLKGLLLHEKRVERSLGSRDIRYKLIRTTASIGVEKKTTDNINVEFFYDFSVVNTYDVQPDIVLSKEDTGTLIISALRPGLIYDTRDSPFEPTSGILAGVTAKVASFLLFSETDFAKLSFYFNNYFSLQKGLVFATSLRGGFAKGFRNTQELPLVERFFLGGRTTVRGYEQDGLGPKGSDGNPTGGNLFAMGNLELRTDIGKGIGIVSFLDFGNVWQRTDQFSGLKYTTGLGLRYNTPVGPLRVDYGFKLNRDKGDSKGQLHFSLGHAF